jgi:hypothetical protein
LQEERESQPFFMTRQVAAPSATWQPEEPYFPLCFGSSSSLCACCLYWDHRCHYRLIKLISNAMHVKC